MICISVIPVNTEIGSVGLGSAITSRQVLGIVRPAPCDPSDLVVYTMLESTSALSAGVNTADITVAFTWGFGAVLLGWVIGWSIGSFLSVIRKL